MTNACVLLCLLVPSADDVESLLSKTESRNPAVRDAAVTAVAKLGEAAVPAVVEALKSDSHPRYAGAAGVILEMTPPPKAALPVLLEMLKSDDINRVRVGVMALVGYGPEAAEHTPAVLATLSHENMHVRYATCKTLAAIGPGAKAAVPELLDRLKTDRASVRGHAALALGGIGVVEDHDVVAALVEASADPSDLVRERAIVALGNIGPPARDALPTLRERMNEESTRNHVDLTVTVWRISEEAAEPVRVLSTLVDDLNWSLEAIRALGTIGPAANEALPKLVTCLASIDPDVRFEAVQSLPRIAPTAARTHLQRVAESDTDPEVRAMAKRLLDTKPEDE